MRIIYYTPIVLIFLLSPCLPLSAQTSRLWGDVPKGPHEVGFKVEHSYDYSRPVVDKYTVDGKLAAKERARPIQIAIWYPAKVSSSQKIKFGEYVNLIATETDFDRNVDQHAEYVTDQFKQFLMGYLFKPDSPEETIREIFNTTTEAVRKASPAEGRFPLIVLGQGNMDSIHRNAILAEALASHGFVVATMPSATRIKNVGDFVEDQARDFEFVINHMYTTPNVNTDKLALHGFSLGGNSGGKVLNRNRDVDALICLDCGAGSSFGTPELKEMEEYVTAKNKPVDILNIYKSGPMVDGSFLKSFRYSDQYHVELGNLPHFNFTTAGVIAGLHPELVNNPNWLVGGEKALQAHDFILEYTIHFAKAYFQNDPESREFLNKRKRGAELASLINEEKRIEGLEEVVPSMNQFITLLTEGEHEKALDIFNRLKISNPDLVVIDERSLPTIAQTQYFGRDNAAGAIPLMKFQLANYPKSIHGHSFIARAYIQTDQKALAKKHLEETLKIDPENEFASSQLKQLEE